MIGDSERRRAAMDTLLSIAEHDMMELGADLRAIRFIPADTVHAAKPEMFASASEAYNTLYLLATNGQIPVAQPEFSESPNTRFRIRAAWYEAHMNLRADYACVDRLTAALTRRRKGP